MFEKEAEEYADKDFGMFEPTTHERYAKETDWRNGAEFGYNKCLEESTNNYNAIIADYDKEIKRLKLNIQEDSVMFQEKVKKLNKKLSQSNKDFDEMFWRKNEIIAEKNKQIAVLEKKNAELKKANEWHYVKDGDLPKDEDWKWCVSYRGYYYVAKYEEMFECWINQEYSEVMQPYAWKEIVLPELPKE